MTLRIFHATRSVPRALFSRIQRRTLGKNYTLSIIFTSPSEMQRLNRRYRKKNKPTDILSFAFGKKSGELYLSLKEVTSHAKKFNMSASQYLPFLVIHGALHLKGLAHGRTMELLEIRHCRALRLHHPTL